MEEFAKVAPPIVWTFEPSVIVGVLALSIIYVIGWQRARRPGEPHPPGYGRLALFVGAMLCVVAALISPIDALSDGLMVIHMSQHILLLDLMPILLILSLTKGILRPVTRRVITLESRAGFFGHPAFAIFAYVGAMWLWHAPPLYDAALAHQNIHVLEHVCFAAAGFLYWWHLLSPIRSRMRLGGMGPVMYMVITKGLVGILGVVLAFSPGPLYPWYQHHAHYWGISARVDQNLAGALMALEQSIVMGIALVYLFVQMLTESEREQQRAERYEVA
jgi:cytochrome c oxidase assembly factor CtaG